MRTYKHVAFAAAVILSVTLIASQALSQDKQPQGMPSDAEMQAMMEQMGRVGPEHKRLKEQFAGNWSCEVTAYWGPSPETSTGTMRSEMMLGDRFLHSMFEGTAMGQPFQGAGVMGYDNMKQKYFSTWMDSMSTGLMVSEGTYDASAKTYTLTGEAPGPDGKPCTFRQVTRVESNDKHVFEMYGPDPAGNEMKMIQIVYTRKS